MSGRVGLSGCSAPGRAGKRGEEQGSVGKSREARGRAGKRGGGCGSVGLRRPIRGMKQGSHAATSVQRCRQAV